MNALLIVLKCNIEISSFVIVKNDGLIDIKYSFIDYKKLDWNAYKEYTPENVMKIFHKIAIEPFIEIRKKI